MRIALGAVLFTLLSVGGALAQTSWTTLQPAGAGFSVTLPGTPTYSESPDSDVKGAVQHMYTLKAPGEYFLVMYVPYPAGSFGSTTTEQYYDNVRDGFEKSAPWSVRFEQPLTIAGYPAREILFEQASKGIVVRLRVVRVGDTGYLIAAGGANGFEASADAVHFLDSFRVVSP